MDIQKMKIEEVVELTAEEKELQAQLRQRYINNVKKNFRAQLDGIKRKN